MRRLFPSQLETEIVYLVIRQHPFILFVRLFVWAFFASGLVVFQYFGPQRIPGLFEGTAGKFTGLVEQIYLLILLLSLFLILIIYYLTIQVITDIRIVDVEQDGLFSHTVSELHIDKIEDVTSKTTGIFGTIFNYGDVFIQTAGTVERFEFDDVPNPSAIEKLILDLYEKNSNFAKEVTEGNKP